MATPPRRAGGTSRASQLPERRAGRRMTWQGTPLHALGGGCVAVAAPAASAEARTGRQQSLPRRAPSTAWPPRRSRQECREPQRASALIQLPEPLTALRTAVQLLDSAVQRAHVSLPGAGRQRGASLRMHHARFCHNDAKEANTRAALRAPSGRATRDALLKGPSAPYASSRRERAWPARAAGVLTCECRAASPHLHLFKASQQQRSSWRELAARVRRTDPSGAPRPGVPFLVARQRVEGRTCAGGAGGPPADLAKIANQNKPETVRQRESRRMHAHHAYARASSAPTKNRGQKARGQKQ